MIDKVIIFCLTCLAVSVAAEYKEINDRVKIDEKLGIFLGSLEKYTVTPNEVVFLLDESGSIGKERYEQVKLFTSLTVRRLSVSAEHSRIAVVSFSDHVRTHVNYIKNSYGKNMCTLIKNIDDLDYIGSWTYTSLAMEAARELLVQSRHNSNKIIILITDGMSNDGYSPLEISQILKQTGVIIFAIGVADVNVDEVEAVASTKNHTYILTNFEYIKELNDYLIKETNEVSWDLIQDTSMCNSFCLNHTTCCDDHASCYCGTQGGSYECACDPGYYGTGHRHECHACPKGTYKSSMGNTATCQHCPEHSTTSAEGTIYQEDCICEVGYEKYGHFCKPIQCAKLHAPDGGVLIPTNCSNLYGTRCSLRCQEGFCPYSCNDAQDSPWNHFPLQSRTCLETRNWSGEDFRCEQMQCPVLDHPSNGNHNCTEYSSIFGTVCHFSCEEGYELIGSNVRKCLIDGTWTGVKTHCDEIMCKPLKINNNLKVKPTTCSSKEKPYRSQCRYYCTEGYTLTSQFGKSDGINVCLANRTWSGVNESITCQDISPPIIKCPPSRKIVTESSKATASVHWKEPIATDNVFVSSVVITHPSSIRKPPYTFPIGTTKIVYEAHDSSGFSSTCSFTVTVIDEEPPKVLFCPENIEIYHAKSSVPVTWDEPIFEDNSGKLNPVISNRRNGEKFSWGPPSIIFYNVSDFSGNMASCRFTVRVRHYPCPYFAAPANGAVTCDKWMDGRMCSVFCHPGYQFAFKHQIHHTYSCEKRGDVGKWVPYPPPKKNSVSAYPDIEFPLPDCTRIQKRSALNVTLQMNYTVDVCNEKFVKEMKLQFLQNLKVQKQLARVICPVDKGCNAENVNVSCGTIETKYKRSLREFPQRPKSILIFSFNIQLYPEEHIDLSKSHYNVSHANDDIMGPSEAIIKEIEIQTSKSVRKVYNITSLDSPKVNFKSDLICSVGQVRLKNSCVNCPLGMFREDFSGNCVDCPSATYQDKEKSSSCMPCPKGYTTYQTRSKSLSDCKAPCPSGTYSRTTFEPCHPCPVNTYQAYSGSKDCLKCPRGLQTGKVGSNASSDCASSCKPGYYSNTGLEPCNLCDIGYYQNDSQQTACVICPNGTSTSDLGATSLTQCKEVDLCSAHPCSNLSTCIQLDNWYTCVCPYGYFGKHCEMSINYCESDTCLNEGMCINEHDGYVCICPAGFSGIACEININDCEKDVCRNGGDCIDLVNGYECRCQDGFIGAHCEINVNECTPSSCLNGGTCFDKRNEYKCCCAIGYDGQHCERKLDPCDSIECKNGGICTYNETGISCSCQSGFIGEYCEVNVDDCINFACFNNGSCIDGIGYAACECPLMFTGDHCEEAVTSEYMLNFKNPTTSNYVELKNDQLLNAITVAFFMRTSYRDPHAHPTVLSYSYYNEEKKVLVDNGLTLFDINKVVLYLHGEMLHTGFVANSDSNWHHYAVTWETNQGKWTFYVDGKNIVNGSHVGEREYIWPGIFILGQEQDSLGGTFSTSEAFVGDITQFNVWDYALPEKEIVSLSLSCGVIGNAAVPWVKAMAHLHGTITVSKDVSLCKDIGSCSDSNCHCVNAAKQSIDICKHLVDACHLNTCSNSMPCVVVDSKAYCNCSKGYDGKFCEYDVNECLKTNGGCSHTCLNTLGSHQCTCPEGMNLAEDGFNCKDMNFCETGEQIYLDGERWIHDCQSCSCQRGSIHCSNVSCQEMECRPEEISIRLPGECCQKCLSYSFCTISSNNTLSSFDDSTISLLTEYSHPILEDCIHGLYSVQHVASKNAVSDINLFLYYNCMKIELLNTDWLYLNDKSRAIPFKNEIFYVESENGTIFFQSRSGLSIKWHSSGEILIAVPAENAKNLCGLCGNIQELDATKKGIYINSDGT